jgi:hypothetical protein
MLEPCALVLLMLLITVTVVYQPGSLCRSRIKLTEQIGNGVSTNLGMHHP